MIDYLGYYALAVISCIIVFQCFMFKVVIIDGSMYFKEGKLRSWAVITIFLLSPFFLLIAACEMQPYRVSVQVYRK